MSLRADNRLIKAITILAIACTAIAASALLLMPTDDAEGKTGQQSKAKKKKKSKKAAKAKTLPTVSSFAPDEVAIGGVLTIKGKNFSLGKNKMLVVFKREGSRRYTAKGTATSSKEMSVIVPDVSFDMPLIVPPNGGNPVHVPTVFQLRLVNKYGMMKKYTPLTKSPTIGPGTPLETPEDCDKDGQINDVDGDDDNDLLSDVIEIGVSTDPCDPDSDGDAVSDYYEYRVASEFNGGPILPYPWKRPSPDPLQGDSAIDRDGDHLTLLEEFQLWRYTAREDRFYSDANPDSDLNGTRDDEEDEDGDLLGNYLEIETFTGSGPLRDTSFVDTDSDGDGLCDGYDDQDHDGPPVDPVSIDCSVAPVGLPPGHPHRYTNIGEILYGTNPYDTCDPNPSAIYCPVP